MLTGKASVPTAAANSAALSQPAGLFSRTRVRPAAMNTAAPLSSHLSCRRRSPAM
jgi:hypothetical protein